ncbi:hypothetical protein MMC17_009889 [Xylographa soralifera]|nr:hypothetical protein [Xylographa soralifera]
MTAFLKPWLWPGIEKEVRQILSWKAGAPSASQCVGGAPPYEDDDSNLRIQSSQVPKVVQIIKFLTFDDPVQAVVSDKTTSITATIASAAVEQFNQKYFKRITENTRGCLIQLLQFEIVATHHGPPDDRLTLRIQEFKHLGCDGEGIFGNPRPIINQDGIKQFLNGLKAFRVRVSAKRAEVRNGDREGSLQSQESASEGEDRENGAVNSQLAFSTQHPSRKPVKAPSMSASGREQVQNAEMVVTAEDTSFRTSYISSEEVEQNILSLLKQPGEVERTNSPLTTLASSFKPREFRAKPLNHSELLALLKKNSSNGIVRPVISHESAQRCTSNRSAVSRNHSKGRGSPKAQGGKVDEVASTIKKAGNSAQSILNKGSEHHVVQPNAINEADQPESPSALPQGLSTSTVALQSRAVVSQNLDRPSLPLPLAGAFCKGDEEDPWHGMLYIKRKDVTIPKNQQILLERKDCWLPPEPGSRGPIANIPVPVLQTITAVIEGHTVIKSITAVVHQEDNDCDSVSEPAEISLSNPDILRSPDITYEDEDLPISTAEWPPSSPPTMPKVEQLPPDSSPEVTLVYEKKVEQPSVRTNDPEMPSSNGRASVATKRSISEIDAQVQIGSAGKSKLYEPLECHNLQQRRERKSAYDMNLDSTDSDADFDDCREIPTETEAEVSKYNAQSRIGYAEETDDEVESGCAKLNKSSYDIEDELKIINVRGSPGKLLPVNSNEEVFSHQQASHPPLRSGHHDDTLLATTKHHSKLPGEVTFVNDTEIAYLSSSELETSVPNALYEGNTTTHLTQQHSTPMDISDSRKSTLQVHRTPYTNQDHRVKTGILPRKLVTENPAKTHQTMEEVTRHNNMSDDDSMTEEVVPGTYSHLNSAEKSVTDQSRVRHTRDAEMGAPIFHGRWVPYVSEEATVRTRKKYESYSAVGNITDPVRVTKRRTENSTIKSPNITKHRKRAKSSKVIKIEDDQRIEDPATESRQLRREVLNNINAQPRTSALIPEEVRDTSSNKILDAAPAEPVLPHSIQHNRGLSASQGLCETKTTCTQTPEATSSRSGTPWRDVRITELESGSQLKTEAAPPLQNMPNELSTDFVDRSIFSSFQKAYPSYHGNEKHFFAMCRKIRTLEMDHRMEHKSLWDDFIIRHQMEYRAYLYECSEQADDPMSYENFYHAKIDEPQFSKRIVTPNNLYEAISESLQNGDSLVTNTEISRGDSIYLARDRHEPQETARLQVTEALYMETPVTRNSPSRDISPLRRNSSARHTPTIQLNPPQQYSASLQRNSPSEARLTPQQSTPTKPAVQLSPILGTPRTAEKTPRSLPWKRKISDDPSPSGRNSKRRNVSNNAISLSEPHQIQASVYPPTQNATAVRPVYPITADPFKAGFSAAIPSPTKAAGIRNNKTQKDARKGSDAISSPIRQPFSVRNTTASPRPIAQTTPSSLSTSKKAMPVSLKTSEAPAQPWYLDPVNPFKSFARADASIRSGNGNAFMDERNKQRVKEAKVEVENGVVLTKMKKIDVLAWEL